MKIGGPATGMAGGEFVPGRYLREGYVITSRGCPNMCWFCSVPIREGNIRELPIRDGWNVLDDNLLACSEAHVRNVFAMLARQRERAQFTGGLEAARMKRWIAEGLRELHPKQIFFAYDTPCDRDPLHAAGKLLRSVGFTTASHTLRAYVLIGYPPRHLRRCREAAAGMRAGRLPPDGDALQGSTRDPRPRVGEIPEAMGTARADREGHRMIALRPYQLQLIDLARQSFAAGHHSVLVVAPYRFWARQLFLQTSPVAPSSRGNRVMVLVHRREIMEQTRAKLYDLGLTAGMIAPGRPPTAEMVQVAMIQTLVRRLSTVRRPDLIIVDECHHVLPDN